MACEAIRMKGNAVMLAFAIVALAASGIASAGTSGCADGTKHWGCSTTQPGFVCIDGSLSSYVSFCPCSKFPGYQQQGEGDFATCIQAKCSDGSSNGQCSTTKPKLCVNGALVDNATKCGCPDPAKQSVSSNGLSCVYKPCVDNGVNVNDGACSLKTSGKKCVQGALVDSASTCPCKTGMTKVGEQCVVLCDDGTKTGECSSAKPKECILTGTGTGYLKDNAAKCHCPDGKTAVGSQCTDSVIGAFTGTDLLSGSSNSSNSSGAFGSSSALSCCCLPAALIGIVGGFAFARKRDA
jgi:hypothetical protein